jgi:acyl carrier protein
MMGMNPEKLADEDSLLDKGIVDSTGVLELIGFLEENYDIQIEDEELIPDNLDSVVKLVNFINRKKSG